MNVRNKIKRNPDDKKLEVAMKEAIAESLAKGDSEIEVDSPGITGLEAFAKLLESNQDLLLELGRFAALGSQAELAKKLNRSEGNVSRSTSRLSDYGLVRKDEIPGAVSNRKSIYLPIREVNLRINFAEGKISVKAVRP